jgi:hypothetical protein
MSENTVKLYVPAERSSKHSAPKKRSRKKIHLRDDYVLEDFYTAVRNNRLDSIHVPHSDVFFVKAAMEHHLGMKFKLKDVEAAMRAEGWNESRVLVPYKQKVLAND